MGLGETNKERRERKERDARRQEWIQEMHGRGITVMGEMELSKLRDCRTLLALARRRFDNPFVEKELCDKIATLVQELDERLAKTLSYREFDRQEQTAPYAPEPNVILFRAPDKEAS